MITTRISTEWLVHDKCTFGEFISIAAAEYRVHRVEWIPQRGPGGQRLGAIVYVKRAPRGPGGAEVTTMMAGIVRPAMNGDPESTATLRELNDFVRDSKVRAVVAAHWINATSDFCPPWAKESLSALYTHCTAEEMRSEEHRRGLVAAADLVDAESNGVSSWW